MTTTQAASRLTGATGLKRTDVGYAGMKDRRARTRQWFSLRLPAGEETRLQSAEDEKLRILQSRPKHRKNGIGSHRAYRFVNT
ncbi:MAG: tRNA pseudouridine(13) synthase TruD [Gammaproteobacteria bacterium]|nr:tRNA pseudouridine(13) synthase TruD [Gammaproteobacteria bacterium]